MALMAEEQLIFFQLIICSMMVGVIWTVQLVVYPLFGAFERREHHEQACKELSWLHALYTPKISYVVIPLMFSELGLSLFHLYKYYSSWALVAGILVLGNWLCTFFISMPLHQKVAQSKDLVAAAKLTVTNWPRTVMWSARMLLLATWWTKVQ